MTSPRNCFKVVSVFLLLRVIETVLAEDETKDAPCPFEDTVDLTGITPENGFYLYEGIMVPENRTGKYNYKILYAKQKNNSDIHVRGCVCDLKPCLSFCCPPGYEFNNVECVEVSIEPYELVKITLKNKTITKNGVFDQFAIQYNYKPCNDSFYFLEGENGQYSLFENGSILTSYNGRILTKEKYCMSPLLNEDEGEMVFTPVNCGVEINPETIKTVQNNAIALMISVPFMILTMIVYLSIPELRTLHNLAFCCYLGGLSVGYSILIFLNTVPTGNIANFDCAALGYAAYFAFMSAFFWLSVISFDLFYNTHTSHSHNAMKRFRLYFLYSYGLAFIFLVCTYTAQNSPWISGYLKSGIGSEEFCFLNGFEWGPLIYFYGPILIIISFNSIMFILTFLQVKRGIALFGSHNTHQTYNDNKILFVTFVRLFLIMGIIWLAETISFLTPQDSAFRGLLNVLDFLNGIQGLIIFLLFVLRKSVIELILKKCGRNGEMDLSPTEEMSERL